ncbi:MULTISPECIES: DUF6303 family protein [unclassified Streptomyces]|uniref:DUF6303 family protein n=1 Tax=unclassified Streptomyces TaxID=2593676 RepID=UPI00381E0D66
MARLVSRSTGLWVLYVVTDDARPSTWPTVYLARASAPTWPERLAFLASLGYEPVEPGAAWEWEELSGPDDYRVRLSASLPVRPLAEEGAS